MQIYINSEFVGGAGGQGVDGLGAYAHPIPQWRHP